MDRVTFKKKRERENSVFTTQFMAQLRFVSVGFVSCPLPAVDRLVCTGGLNPVSRPESKRFHPLESPLQSKHVQGDSGGRMEMRRASWHPLAPSPQSAPRCFVLSPSIPERFFVPPVTRLQNTWFWERSREFNRPHLSLWSFAFEWEGRGIKGVKWLGLPDWANKNTRCPVKSEFQRHDE